MGWVSGVAVYIIVWWVVIFMVLPWGVRSIQQDDVLKGHAAGSPQQPRLVLKLVLTTIIAAVIWVIIYFIIDSGAISFRE